MSAKQQLTIGGIAFAVVAGLIILVVMLRKGPAPAKLPPGATAGSTQDDPDAGAAARSGRPSLPHRAGSTSSSGEPDEDQPERSPEKIAARDHRPDAPIRPDGGAPFILPAEMQVHRMKPDTIMVIRRAMRPVVARCAEGVPAEARGARPLLQGEIIVTVQDGRIMVDEARFQYRDIEESAHEPLAACVRKEVETFDFPLPPAGDEPVNQFTLTMPFDI